MRNTLKTLFLLAVAGALIFTFRVQLSSLYQNLSAKYFPCSAPIKYSIGIFDNRFGISQNDFLKAVSQAEAIWEKPIGKDLLDYNSNGGLKINLIYDYRQEATIKLSRLGIVVSNTKASYNAIKIKYEAMKADYETGKAQLDSRIAAVQKRQNAYNQEVLYWNQKGGAPKNIFDELNAEKSSIENEISGINTEEDRLNANVSDINALVVTLNKLAASLNLGIEQFNAIGQARGGEFEEGDYQSGPGGSEIDIYQFDNNQQLVRVLAHEFGHALGLDHSEDPKAIMYRLNQGENEKLTSDDIKAIKTRCGIK